MIEFSLTPKPGNNDVTSFDSWCDWTLFNLNRLISQKPGIEKKTAIEKLLHRATIDYKSGKASGAIDLAHLVNFLDDMEYLYQRDITLFSSYQEKLNSGVARGFGYLTGVWFEVRTSRQLYWPGVRVLKITAMNSKFSLKVSKKEITYSVQ